MNTIPDVWHIVKFPDGGTYCNGPQPDGTKGGILAFEDVFVAQRVAQSVGGHTEERKLDDMKLRCRELKINLFLRRDDGRTQGFVLADDHDTTQHTFPVTSPERNAILSALSKK